MTSVDEAARAGTEQRGHLDLRLLPAAVATWVVAWLTPALSGPMRWTVPALALPAAATLLVKAWRRDRGPGVDAPRATALATVAAVLACAGAAGLASAARVQALDAGPIPDLAAQRASVAVVATVRAYPAIHRGDATRPGGARTFVAVPVQVRELTGRGQTVRLHAPIVLRSGDLAWAAVLPGQRIAATGRLSPAQPRTPSAALLWADDPPRTIEEAPWPSRAAAGARADMREAAAGLPEPQRGLLPGLVLGDTSGADPDLADDFRVSGLAHLTAVSGANVAILVAVVLGTARRAGVRRVLLPPLGVATILGFAAVVGPEPSLLRAALMGLLAVLALGLGRPNRAAPALLAAAIVLLLADPWLARSYGFALSASATAGLLVFATRWTDAWSSRMPRLLAAALAVPAAAQVACAPLIVLLSGDVSLVAVPANLLAMPAVAPAMCFGLVAAAAQSICPPLAAVFAHVAGIAAWWIVAVARWAAGVPGPTLDWPNGVPGALALAAVSATLLAGWPALRRSRLGPTLRPVGRVLVVLALVAAACLIGRPTVPLPGPLRALHWPPAGWQVVACDVGQGDGLVLNVAPGTAVVVDTGPDPDRMDRCLRRLGVRDVPYVLLTHFHADHIGGLAGVLRGRRVAEIGASPLAEPAVAAVAVARQAAAAGARLGVAVPGEERAAQDLRWRVLWPRLLLRDGSAANNASVVLAAESPTGLRILLAGDIEPAAQAALHRAEPNLRADVLKTPHHGSGRQDFAFLRSLGARVAITSAGADNDYGHPAPLVVRALADWGATHLRTDTSGDVAVGVVDGRVRAWTRS
ncbi:MAG: ComEC/Rec2 family competence protein [Sporichthyaceae bacterium]